MKLEEGGQGHLAERIAPYRAGYTPQQRREIEAALRAATCWPSRRPTRWSSASTSASSTRRSASTSPAPSRACARCGGAPGAGGAGSPSTSPARTRSTSSSAATPTSSWSARSRRRSSTTATSRSRCSTWSPRPTSRRWAVPDDDEILGEGWRQAADRLVSMGELRKARGERYMTRGGDFVAGRISLRSASPDSVAVVDSSLRRDARPGRGRARLLHRPPRRHLPAPRSLLRGRRARPRGGPGGGAGPSTATTTPR